MQRFTFHLDWVINGQFAGLCWALAKGLYHHEGLDVRLEPWCEDGRSIVEKVLAGGICAGSSEDNLIVAARAHGAPVRALAAMLQVTPLVLMTTAKSGIRRFADLKGRRVALHCDGVNIFRALLELNGLDESDLTLCEVTHDLDNLYADRFDAVQGYAVAEPLELARRGLATRVIPLRHHELHPFAQMIFAADDVVARHEVVVQRFVRATLQGWRAVADHIDEAAAVTVAVSGRSADIDLERATIEAIVPLVLGDAGPEHIGRIDAERFARNLRSYQRHGIIDRPMDLREVLDNKGG
ncbi:MAG: ABC transporter substrate-binding protein [Pseudomonadota bacterium]